jgi:phasin family protein
MITLDQITEAQKNALESAYATGQQLFARGEAMLALNVAATKHTLGAAAEHAHNTLSAKDPQSFMSLQVAAAQPMGEKVVAYGKEVMAISQAAAADLGKAYESTAGGAQERTTEWFEAAAKNAPAGFEGFFSMTKNFMDASTRMTSYAQDAAAKAAGAFDTVVKQAQANVASVASVTPINSYTRSAGTKTAKRK